MDDLISRQAAIEALCLSGTRMERDGKLVLATVEAKQWAVDTLEDVPPAQRWIPVTEPPEKKGYYLVYLDDDSTEVALWAEHHYFGKFEWRVSNWKEVTHWMPLPEPPKEEET